MKASRIPIQKLLACIVAVAVGSSVLVGCSMFENENTAGTTPLLTDEVASSNSEGSQDLDCYLPLDPFNTEEYAATDENGFISTLTSPLSTFAADVDTASYANLRRMISEGHTLSSIPTGAVRVEEMLNYFDYAYPSPQNGELFGVSTQASACPWNSDTQLLIMGFSTDGIDYAETEGSNLVFLIDTSGSMGGQNKLSLLQDSLMLLLDQLSERDTISIVTYAGSERVVCEGVAGNDRRKLQQAIKSLRAEGSTNGQAGLQKAYEIAEKNFIEGGNNRIIMGSDGDLNVGITSTSELHDFVSKKRDNGVYLSVLGFGSGNYKDTKMETLADNGNGAYHYIDCLAEAEKVFGKDLCANLVTIAKDVKFQVEFNPEQVKGYRLVGYENRALSDEDFLDDTVDAGEVGRGHQVTVAYELVLNDSQYAMPTPDLKYQYEAPRTTGETDWLTCSIRYVSTDSNESHENSVSVDEGSFVNSPSDDWLFASSVIEVGMIASDSKYRGSASLEHVNETLQALRLNDEWKQGFVSLVQYL